MTGACIGVSIDFCGFVICSVVRLLEDIVDYVLCLLLCDLTWGFAWEFMSCRLGRSSFWAKY